MANANKKGSDSPPTASSYRRADVSMSAIRRFARRVAERFRPEKIILFGSFAYGTPHADSDVDILVVMSARNRHDQAVKIRSAVPRPFAMDLIVRTPQDLKRRLAHRDMFHTEIVTKGKVLYEAGDARTDEPPVPPSVTVSMRPRHESRRSHY